MSKLSHSSSKRFPTDIHFKIDLLSMIIKMLYSCWGHSIARFCRADCLYMRWSQTLDRVGGSLESPWARGSKSEHRFAAIIGLTSNNCFPMTSSVIFEPVMLILLILTNPLLILGSTTVGRDSMNVERQKSFEGSFDDYADYGIDRRQSPSESSRTPYSLPIEEQSAETGTNPTTDSPLISAWSKQ